jgi:hypothetical protein
MARCADGTRQALDFDMSTELAGLFLAVCAAYLALGAAFALAFVGFGVSRIDPDAKGMPLAARCLLWPGAALLWPLMLYKWLTQKAPPLI